MLHATLPGLDFPISRIGFGGAALSGGSGGYGFGSIDKSQALSLVHEAFESGINLFDTAPVYGYGQSEELIGMALQEPGLKENRGRICVVDKGGVSWNQSKRIYHSNDPKILQQMLEESLRRLRCDYIDIYFVHAPDHRVPLDVSLAPLFRAQERGEIRLIGLSNYVVEDIKEATARYYLTQTTLPGELPPGTRRISVLQNEFNVFEEAIVRSLFPLIESLNLGFIGYATLDKGLLSETITRERLRKNAFEPSDFRHWASWWKKKDHSYRLEKVEAIRSFLSPHGYSMLEFALASVLRFKQLSSALCGMKNKTQLTSLLSALEHLPPSDLVEEARRKAGLLSLD